MDNKKLTIIGGGKMGSVIAVSASAKFDVLVIEPDIERGTALEKNETISVSPAFDKNSLSDYYLIAVKPQNIDDVLNQIKDSLTPGSCLISIAAGVSIEHIKKIIPEHVKVIRAMPNTPALFGEGVTGISGFESAADISEDESAEIMSIFDNAIKVSEDKMDLVTALSGSGPAYFFYIAQIMEKFALENGIKNVDARKLISQTILGAGKMMIESDKTFKQLKDDVTSPGGTTAAALNSFEIEKLEDIFTRALNKAKERSQELSEGK